MDFLLLQTGDFLLLQGGGKIILESSPPYGDIGNAGRLSRRRRRDEADDDDEVLDLIKRMLDRIDP